MNDHLFDKSDVKQTQNSNFLVPIDNAFTKEGSSSVQIDTNLMKNHDIPQSIEKDSYSG